MHMTSILSANGVKHNRSCHSQHLEMVIEAPQTAALVQQQPTCPPNLSTRNKGQRAVHPADSLPCYIYAGASERCRLHSPGAVVSTSRVRPEVGAVTVAAKRGLWNSSTSSSGRLRQGSHGNAPGCWDCDLWLTSRMMQAGRLLRYC